MLAQRGVGVLHETLAAIAIVKQLRNSALERLAIANLDCTVVRHQRLSEHGEVLHVRTKYDRFARKDRFHRILPAVSREAFPDEHDSRDVVPPLKFTGRIQKQAIGIGGSAGKRDAGECDAQRQSVQLGTDFC